jgi:hypothetical protein
MPKIVISDLSYPENGMEIQSLPSSEIENVFGGINALEFLEQALSFLQGHSTVVGHWQNDGSGDGSGFLLGIN